jgi:HAD superfamily hydrolase (TIGR01509 family)
MFETLIFDMDGVIIDSEPIHMELQYQLFRYYDINMTPEEYQGFIGRSTKNMWQELIQQYALSVTIDEVLTKDRDLYHQRLKSEQRLQPIAGIPGLIASLYQERIKLVLASSSSMPTIELVLNLFELEQYFEHKVSGADLQFSKPHPEIFEVAAALSGTERSRCLVIEDSGHGVTAAKKAGMKCIGFRNPNSGNQDLRKADLIVDSIEEVSLESIMKIA